MIIFSVCPCCNAPVYDDPLNILFVDTGTPMRVYECGARLDFHTAPPVHVEIVISCPYAFRKWIEKAEANPPSDFPAGAYWKLVYPTAHPRPDAKE